MPNDESHLANSSLAARAAHTARAVRGWWFSTPTGGCPVCCPTCSARRHCLSPCLAAPERQRTCLVASTDARDGEFEQLLACQDRGSGAKPALEFNMHHAFVLARSVEEKMESDGTDLSAMLLAQTQILDGKIPLDPAGSWRPPRRERTLLKL